MVDEADFARGADLCDLATNVVDARRGIVIAAQVFQIGFSTGFLLRAKRLVAFVEVLLENFDEWLFKCLEQALRRLHLAQSDRWLYDSVCEVLPLLVGQRHCNLRELVCVVEILVR